MRLDNQEIEKNKHNTINKQMVYFGLGKLFPIIVCNFSTHMIYFADNEDDTLTIFDNPHYANKFLDYLNQQHANITFILETESNETMLLSTQVKLQGFVFKLSSLLCFRPRAIKLDQTNSFIDFLHDVS